MPGDDREQAEKQITALYERMYDAMIAKDVAALQDILDERFVLVHMTGLRQSREAFLRSVADGTLNYYEAIHHDMPVEITGDTAVISGQSFVEAAVFGGGRHRWRLQQRITLKRKGDVWRMVESMASTW